jgi:[acyl-carrier-protein] S-malonyltransferase
LKEELKETKLPTSRVLHSVIFAKTLGDQTRNGCRTLFRRVFSFVANGTLSFEDGLKLVSQRALAMQKLAKSNHQQWQQFRTCG